MTTARTTASKLLRLCTPDPRGECILWDGGQNHKGYGYLRVAKGELPDHPRMARVHRIAYWLFRGPFDLSLDIDHTCHVRLCVNQYHLQLSTTLANALDATDYQWHEEDYMVGQF